MRRTSLIFFAVSLGAAGLFARDRSEEASSLEDHYSISKLDYLFPGRYKCLVSGVLCNACTRGIVEGLRRIKGVKDAQFDFEDGRLWITIEKGKRVKARGVVRALHHAERRVNLGTRFEVTDIRFVP